MDEDMFDIVEEERTVHSSVENQQNDKELAKADNSKGNGKEKLLDIKFDHFGDEDENVSGCFYGFNLELASSDRRKKEKKDNMEYPSEGITVQNDFKETVTAGAKDKKNNENFENPLAITISSDSKGLYNQNLSDVLLFWSHSDPMLRGHVQIIVANYFAGESMQSQTADYHIGILIKVSFSYYL